MPHALSLFRSLLSRASFSPNGSRRSSCFVRFPFFLERARLVRHHEPLFFFFFFLELYVLARHRLSGAVVTQKEKERSRAAKLSLPPSATPLVARYATFNGRKKRAPLIVLRDVTIAYCGTFAEEPTLRDRTHLPLEQNTHTPRHRYLFPRFPSRVRFFGLSLAIATTTTSLHSLPRLCELVEPMHRCSLMFFLSKNSIS